MDNFFIGERGLCLSEEHDTDEKLQDEPPDIDPQGPTDDAWRGKLYGSCTPLWVEDFWFMFCTIPFLSYMMIKADILELIGFSAQFSFVVRM